MKKLGSVIVMRKITLEACRAFNEGKPYKKSNTEVVVLQDINGNTIPRMYLFGNLIAKKSNGHTLITFCGHPTVTTKERLNGLSNVRFTSRKGKLYMDDLEISSWNWYVI